jgi:hypothetical protein
VPDIFFDAQCTTGTYPHHLCHCALIDGLQRMSKSELSFAANALALNYIFLVKDNTPCSMKSNQCHPSAGHRQHVTDLILKVLARDIFRVKRERDGASETIRFRASALYALARGFVVICRNILLLIEFEIRWEQGARLTEGLVGTGYVRAKVVLYDCWIRQLSLVCIFSWEYGVEIKARRDHWIVCTIPQVTDLLVDSIVDQLGAMRETFWGARSHYT